MLYRSLLASLATISSSVALIKAQQPIVINTWNFDGAAAAAWEEINKEEATAIDAVEVIKP